MDATTGAGSEGDRGAAAVLAAAPAHPPQEEAGRVAGGGPTAERESRDGWLSEVATGYVILAALALVQLAWVGFLAYLVLAAL